MFLNPLFVAILMAPDPIKIPVMSINEHPEFRRVVEQEVGFLSKSQFDQAAPLGPLLPKRAVVYKWEDSAVSDNLKEMFAGAREKGFSQWKRITDLTFTPGANPDIVFHFVTSLPPDSTGFPANAKLSFGTSPRLDVTIGLMRGKPLERLSEGDVYSEAAHAIGAYLGVADNPLPGSAMHPTPYPNTRPLPIASVEVGAAFHNLRLADLLRKALETKTPVEAALPDIEFSPTQVDLGIVKRGDRVPIHFTVKNTGQGVLTFELVPDCGCFSPMSPAELNPGETKVVTTTVDTSYYQGTMHKAVVMFSNSAKGNGVEIPVRFRSVPSFRLYRPEGEVFVEDEKTSTADVLLTLPPGSKAFPSEYHWDGTEGKVTMGPYHGMAADPEMDEPATMRDGYVFHVHFSPNIPSGRPSGTLTVKTGLPDFPQAQYTLFVQKGILASPDRVPLGLVSKPAYRSFLVSRPGKPFKVLSAESSSSYLNPLIIALPDSGDYRIDVDYNGKAPVGDFLATITVKTDDPKQPTIEVTVFGTIQ